ncbi:DUF3226 domain-containing protein [Cronbergia sp. UHCC 0137]|uniref:DUF3226 domain-containing protein n=1 Tax=Cronbergia sp. UHCC 0137 TaxID=3110239 RepID=UPI002B20F726|nr:DUF3226 domain-containing protein [Cronbergia sp. UHCC 0137]MEA5620343.1 DUF3226 domain-containing protein [Cronbergia sp. UHCC 0137]
MSGKLGDIYKTKLLLGEGVDEVRFFQGLLKYLNITDVQVEAYEGKDKLGNYLKTLPLRPGYRELISLGITRDADKSTNNAFDSICGFLKNAKLPIPSKTKETVGDKLKVSVLIIPDYQNSGMLEDVCLEAVKSDPIISCIDDYFKCISYTVGQDTKEIAKARLKVWLASQIKPDMRLGEAAQAGYFPWNSSAFDGLKQFLESL